jgi:hypothetical protein
MADVTASLSISYTDDNGQCKDISSSWSLSTITEDSRMTARALSGVRRVLLGALETPAPPPAGLGQLDAADLIVVVNRGASDCVLDVTNSGGDVAYFHLGVGEFMTFNNQDFEADGAGAAFAAFVKIGEIGAEGIGGTALVEVSLYSVA